jgi:thiol-disulfide isomerase/thioredoxin
MLPGMKTLLTAAWLAAAASGFCAAPFCDLSFEAASREAARTGKIVLIDFYTTWSDLCKKLEQNTWTDAEVIQLLQKQTVALRLDADKETALAKRYKIDAYPSVLLLKPDGTEIDRLVGYLEPGIFVADFHAALEGKDSVSRARDAVMVAGTNDPSARMELGVTLARKGQDPEALAEYLWCFDHGAEANPGFVRVRLSFLLGHIKNLADRYPPAGKALEDRRDADQAKAAAGATNVPMIMELVSLNNALGQKEKNLAVFDRLPAGCQARDNILMLFADQFLEARRYADLLQGTDGTAAFNTALDRYNKMLDSTAKDSPMRDQMETTMRQMTVTVGAHGFEALAGLKRNQDARNLAGQILKFDSTPATRATLTEAAKRAGNAGLAEFVKQ